MPFQTSEAVPCTPASEAQPRSTSSRMRQSAKPRAPRSLEPAFGSLEKNALPASCHTRESIGKTRWAHGTMLMATVLIATSFPVVASIAGAMDSVVLTLLRFALASLLFLPLVALRYRLEVIPNWRSLVRYAALSAPLVGFFLAMFEALRTTTAVNSGALFTFGPSFAALFAVGLTT